MDMKAPELTPVPPDPLALSPSKIDTLNCPHRYQKVYVEFEEEGTDPEFLALGSLAHLVAADYMSHLASFGFPTDHSKLDEIAKQRWENRSASVGVECYEDYQLFIDRFRDYSLAETEEILGVENRIAFDKKWNEVDWHSDGVAFGGIIDLATTVHLGLGVQGVKIRDWTTASLAGWFSTKKDLQLRMYALLAYRKWGIANVEVTAHSLRTGVQKTVSLGAEDHAETVERIIAERGRLRGMMDQPSDRPWDAVPCQQCSICRIECPALEGALKLAIPLRIDDRLQATNLLQQLILLDRRRKSIVAVLKSYVGVHGAVESGGIRAGFKVRETRTHPANQVYDMLIAAGVNDAEAWDVMTVNKARLKRLTKKDKTLREDIDDVVTVKPGERFEALQSAKQEETHEAD